MNKVLCSFITYSSCPISLESKLKKWIFLNWKFLKKYNSDICVYYAGKLNNVKNINIVDKSYKINSKSINILTYPINFSRRNLVNPKNSYIVPIIPNVNLGFINLIQLAIKNYYDYIIICEHDFQILNDFWLPSWFQYKKSVSCWSKMYNFLEANFILLYKNDYNKCIEILEDYTETPDDIIVEKNKLFETVLPISIIDHIKGDRFGDFNLPESFPIEMDYIAQLPFETFYQKEKSSWVKTKFTDELEDIWID